MDHFGNAGNDREEFPKMKMYENYIIKNKDEISRKVVLQYCSKTADKLVEKSENYQSTKNRQQDNEEYFAKSLDLTVTEAPPVVSIETLLAEKPKRWTIEGTIRAGPSSDKFAFVDSQHDKIRVIVPESKRPGEICGQQYCRISNGNLRLNSNSSFEIVLNNRGTVQLCNRPSQKRSKKSKNRSVKRQCLKRAKSPRRLNYSSSSESSESLGSPDSCWDTTLDSPVLTTSIEQVDNLSQSLAILVNTEPGQLTNLIGIIYQILNSENDKVFCAFHLVDESRLKVRVQIYESSINRARYARLANLEVGQVVSLQNVNFNQLKYLTISSKHETEFEIDPDNVRAGELREWFENGQNYKFKTVGQKQT